MKKILTLFICSFIFVSLNAQQSLQLEVNKVWGSDSPSNSFGLSWYQADGLLSGYAFRASYLSSEYEFDYYTEDMNHVQLDVVKRWHSPTNKKVTLYTEAGISGMVMNEKRNYRYGFCCDLCNCAFIVDPSQIYEVEAYRERDNGGLDYHTKNNAYTLFFLPGATAGGGLDLNFTKHFYIGLQCRVNAYYLVGNEDILVYFHYGASAGFRF